MILNTLFTRVVNSGPDSSQNTFYDFENLQIDGGTDILSGTRIGAPFTASNVGSNIYEPAGNIFMPEMAISVSNGETVTLDFVNNDAGSGGVIASWLVKLS
jgi:hypothetical protein